MKKLILLLCMVLVMQSVVCLDVSAKYATKLYVEGKCNLPELGLDVSESWAIIIENEFDKDVNYRYLGNSSTIYLLLCSVAYDENNSEKFNEDHLEFDILFDDGSKKKIVIDGGRIDIDGKYCQIEPAEYDNLLRTVLGRKYTPFKCIDENKRQFLPYRYDQSRFVSGFTDKRYEGARAEYLWYCLSSMTFTYDGCFEYENQDSMKMLALTEYGNESSGMYMDSERFRLAHGYLPLSFYKVGYQEYIEFVEANKRAENIDSELDFKPAEWAVSYVNHADNKGFLHPINKVNYQKPIDRAEFCNIVYNVFGETAEYDESLQFSDTENPKIACLNELGVISGMGDGTFSPHTNLTREQAAVVFSRLAKLMNKPEGEIKKSYADESDISDWAKSSVDYVTGIGIMRGDDNGNFNPKGNITKQEAIVVLSLLEDINTGRSPKALLPLNEKIKEKIDKYNNENTDQSFREAYRALWFKDIAASMINEESIDERNVVGEYHIADSISFRGIRYINVKVFEDGTGEMLRRFYTSEFANFGTMAVDKSIKLTKEQVLQVTDCFEKNNFWDLPYIHPEESDGCDGNTVFMEAISGDKYNMISMWAPEDEYEIKKIYDEILKLAEEWGLTEE